MLHPYLTNKRIKITPQAQHVTHAQHLKHPTSSNQIQLIRPFYLRLLDKLYNDYAQCYLNSNSSAVRSGVIAGHRPGPDPGSTRNLLLRHCGLDPQSPAPGCPCRRSWLRSLAGLFAHGSETHGLRVKPAMTQVLIPEELQYRCQERRERGVALGHAPGR